MSFNLQKYLTENNLTLISKIREDIDVDSEGPSKSDLKKSEKDLIAAGNIKNLKYNNQENELKLNIKLA